MADVPLSVGLVLSDADVKKVSSQITTDLSGVGAKIGPNIGKGLATGLTGAVRSLIGPIGATLAAAFTFKKIISEASEFEAQVNRLNGALRSAGSFSKQASDQFIDFASQIQKTTTFGDGLTLELSALALNFAKTNDQAIALTKAALDLSVATGQDANTSLRQLGATFDGTTGKLSKLVPELKTLTAEQLKAGAAIDIVAKRFEGAAENEVNTFSGATTQLTNNVGDLAKQLGFLVTQNSATNNSIKATSTFFGELASSVESFRNRGIPSIQNFDDKIKDVNLRVQELGRRIDDFKTKVGEGSLNTPFAKSLTIGLSDARAELERLERDQERFIQRQQSRNQGGPESKKPVESSFTAEEQSARSAQAKSFSDALASQQLAALDNQKKFNETFLQGEALRDANRLVLSEQTSLLVQQQDQRIADVRKNLLETGIISQQQFSEFQQTTIQETGNRIALLNDELRLSEIEKTSGFIDGLGARIQALVPSIQEVGKASTQSLVGGFVKGFSAVGGALAKGENAFEAFGGAVLGALGDIATQWGQYYLLTGLAGQFVPGLQVTAGAIPLGIALLALGGFLQAKAGGAQSKPSSVGSGGFSGASAQTEQPQFNEDQLASRESRVTVNIQGDVLDSQGSALRIVELIREATDNQGAELRFA